ncbi:hypothetical protein MPER_12404 [Moniliophthora perniciosa FA553]|nr:hypothetical protein MPER_12404 [Moniliophthora perniciosa FA553]
MPYPSNTSNTQKSWVWDYFHESKKKYKNDKTHNEAHCWGCIRETQKQRSEAGPGSQDSDRNRTGTISANSFGSSETQAHVDDGNISSDSDEGETNPNSAQPLVDALNQIEDESTPEEEIPLDSQPRVRLHFSADSEELIPLQNVFRYDSECQSRWGGTLWMYEVIGQRTVDKEMKAYDAEWEKEACSDSESDVEVLYIHLKHLQYT